VAGLLGVLLGADVGAWAVVGPGASVVVAYGVMMGVVERVESRLAHGAGAAVGPLWRARKMQRRIASRGSMNA